MAGARPLAVEAGIRTRPSPGGQHSDLSPGSADIQALERRSPKVGRTLKRAGAFASVLRANAKGGSIAHGHVIVATSAVLTTRLLPSMQHDQLKRGGCDHVNRWRSGDRARAEGALTNCSGHSQCGYGASGRQEI